MANINQLEMGEFISKHPHITVKKSLFGLSSKVVYEPTQSKVDVLRRDYDQAHGEQLRQLLAKPVVELEKEGQGSVPQSNIGSVRLEGCLSQDHQFVALQLLTYSDFMYKPMTDVLVYEGKDADVVARIL